jgi:hypothetical protein
MHGVTGQLYFCLFIYYEASDMSYRKGVTFCKRIVAKDFLSVNARS